jgi:hypothetical protein
VAQVLSYAAYLQGFQPAQLETDVLASHLALRGTDTVLGAVETDDQQQAIELRAFTDGLAECLREGSFRLVLVLDDAPSELTQTAGYLQSLTDRIQIDLITVAAYEVNGSRILVPQRVEPARRVASCRRPTPMPGKAARWSPARLTSASPSPEHQRTSASC